jgi:dCMP deaminase
MKYSKQAEFFEVCQVIHAEMDALIKMNHDQMTNHTKIYLLGIDNAAEHIYTNAAPCEICRKLLIELGFTCIFVFQSSTEVKEINLI